MGKCKMATSSKSVPQGTTIERFFVCTVGVISKEIELAEWRQCYGGPVPLSCSNYSFCSVTTDINTIPSGTPSEYSLLAASAADVPVEPVAKRPKKGTTIIYIKWWLNWIQASTQGELQNSNKEEEQSPGLLNMMMMAILL
ncbi:hypothetical protein NDU88_002743 [Pleurodeles waltl]|uniref:Uncharacterized protein n=1 Tax=Pleurodeles waltl TaxID=8319 RepID=A0AAV7UWI3_PLEWA|nr:hypothetical protein NDU88_002743 [Pleurodeles waltl]